MSRGPCHEASAYQASRRWPPGPCQKTSCWEPSGVTATWGAPTLCGAKCGIAKVNWSVAGLGGLIPPAVTTLTSYTVPYVNPVVGAVRMSRSAFSWKQPAAGAGLGHGWVLTDTVGPDAGTKSILVVKSNADSSC